jgi:CheY-like chemotaxis protein
MKALVSPPCLVVTAIRLPLLDGYDLCQVLRRDPATARIPILVVPAAVGSAKSIGHAKQETDDA